MGGLTARLHSGGVGELLEPSLGAKPFGEPCLSGALFGRLEGAEASEYLFVASCREAALPCPEAPALCHRTPGLWRDTAKTANGGHTRNSLPSRRFPHHRIVFNTEHLY